MKSTKSLVLIVLFFLILHFNISCDSIKKDKWKTVTVSEVQQGTVTIAGFVYTISIIFYSKSLIAIITSLFTFIKY